MDGNAQKETCRAPAPGPDGFVPARPRVVLALAVLVLAGMAGFCLALYHSLTAVRPVDPADYPGAAPEGFRWEAAVSREDGRAVFTGWACVEGEPFPDVDIRVVLYHAEDGAYYSIPTQMTPDEAATAAVSRRSFRKRCWHIRLRNMRSVSPTASAALTFWPPRAKQRR